MADVQIDVLAAARAGSQELGRQMADLTIELAAQRAMNDALRARIAELEGGKDTEEDEYGLA